MTTTLLLSAIPLIFIACTGITLLLWGCNEGCFIAAWARVVRRWGR